MASLVVVVIDENDGAVSVEHVPGLVQVPEPFELVDASEILAQELAIPEFRHATHVGVVGSFDRLIICASFDISFSLCSHTPIRLLFASVFSKSRNRE